MEMRGERGGREMGKESDGCDRKIKSEQGEWDGFGIDGHTLLHDGLHFLPDVITFIP